MNCSSTSTPPSRVKSRYFTVRFLRFLGRVVWSRGFLWTIVIFISLVVLFYQYENWNGATELKAARAQMLAVTGTDDFRSAIPATVPEENNFFALPVIKSWREPNKHGSGGFCTRFPGDKLLPKDFVKPEIKDEPGRTVLDLEGWAAVQKVNAGAGRREAAGVLCKALGDGNGILPQLIAGLDRSDSQLIPSKRQLLEEAGDDPVKAGIPACTGVVSMFNNLEIHLRAAALAEDGAKTRDVAGVMLRLADGFEHDPELVGLIVGTAMNRITLKALNEALGCPSLQEADFRKLQEWLGASTDLQRTRRTFVHQLLVADAVFGSFHRHQMERKHRTSLRTALTSENGFMNLLLDYSDYGPSGWIDTNHAFAVEQLSLLCGDAGEEGWRAGADGAKRMQKTASTAATFRLGSKTFIMPRRALGVIIIPAVSGVWEKAAKNVFRRRCAILTCALHRYRLAHRAFPASLTELDSSLLSSPLTDPAKEGVPFGYRLTDKGFVLWSVGEDRNDDGGDDKKDWTWRHEVPTATN